MHRTIALIGLGLSLLTVALPARAHLDAGACLATTEVVLDYVTMISTDEEGDDGPGGREEVRIYTNVATQGHLKQESIFAFADDTYGGLTKDEYDEAVKNGEENPHGDQPIVGHTIYYHVNCIPHEPFDMDLEIWDDDSWGLDSVIKFLKKVLDLPGMPAEVKVWGGVGLAIAELASELSSNSRDNHSKAEIRGKHYDNGQHTEPGKMRCCNDNGWKNGDHTADFVFTVKKQEKGACNFDNWESEMDSFIKQIETETQLKERLRKAYKNLLKEVRDREQTREDVKNKSESRWQSQRLLEPHERKVGDSRVAVDDALDLAAREWSGPDGTIQMPYWGTLEKLNYWADETEHLDGAYLASDDKQPVCAGTASSLDSTQASVPPRSAQVTFTAIEPGDRVIYNPQYISGSAAISFVAVEDGAGDKAPSDSPEVETGESGGYAFVGFAGGMGAGLTALLRGDEGGEIAVSVGLTEPAIVTNGRGSFTFETAQHLPLADVTVSEENATAARSDWVASRLRANGSAEAVYDVAGLPLEACQDGEIEFALTGADGQVHRENRGAVCVNYQMKEITRVGQTAALRATVVGLDANESVEFTFTPQAGSVMIEPLSSRLKVSQINQGHALTKVTGKVPGGHSFGVNMKIIRE